VDVLYVRRIALQARIDLEDDAILVALRVDGRDLPLREGVVERRVDVGDAHAETRRRVAVDLHPLEHLRCPLVELAEVGIPQRELVGRVALAGANADVARGEHAGFQAIDVGELGAHAIDDARRGLAAALVERPQVDEHAPAVGAGAAGAAPRPAD
jgi:hypothetical protein